MLLDYNKIAKNLAIYVKQSSRKLYFDKRTNEWIKLAEVRHRYGSLQNWYDYTILDITDTNDYAECPICGKPLNFINRVMQGYRAHCSVTCAVKHEHIKHPENRNRMRDWKRIPENYQKFCKRMKEFTNQPHIRAKMSASCKAAVKRGKRKPEFNWTFDNLPPGYKQITDGVAYKCLDKGFAKNKYVLDTSRFRCCYNIERIIVLKSAAEYRLVRTFEKFNIQWRYEPLEIRYKCNGKLHWYIPDFEICYTYMGQEFLLLVEYKSAWAYKFEPAFSKIKRTTNLIYRGLLKPYAAFITLSEITHYTDDELLDYITDSLVSWPIIDKFLAHGLVETGTNIQEIIDNYETIGSR